MIGIRGPISYFSPACNFRICNIAKFENTSIIYQFLVDSSIYAGAAVYTSGSSS